MFLVLLVVSIVSGCSSVQKIPERELPLFSSEDIDLVFFDSSVFDKQLSNYLDAGHKHVSVKLNGDAKLNSLPKRIDTWVSMVNENGGKVNIIKVDQQGLPTRGFIMDAVELVFRSVDSFLEMQLFKPTKFYDVTLYYQEGGDIREMLLTHK